jgi:dTDP-glucose 4,6-dehydratase
MKERFCTRGNKVLIDILAMAISFCLSYLIRYEGKVPNWPQVGIFLLPLIAGRLICQRALGVLQHKWRYTGTVEVLALGKAYACFSGVLLALRLVVKAPDPYTIPLGVIVIDFLLSLLMAFGLRVLWRYLYQRAQAAKDPGAPRRLLLVGAGSHGATLASEMALRKGLEVVGFVDDDPKKLGATIAGAKVLGPTSALPEIAKNRKVSDVLICIPPNKRSRFDSARLGLERIHLRIMPTLDEVLDSETEMHQPAATDSRGQVRLAKARSIARPTAPIHGETVLITGGAGFIGSNLADKLADHNRLILYDVGFEGRPVEFTHLLGHPNVTCVTGNLLDDPRLEELCLKSDVVVHAAAVVGVSRVCHAARETLETNYVGTSRILKMLEGNRHLDRFVYFSTSEVFGVNSFQVDEKTSPIVGPIAESRWSYAIAKLAGEHLVKSYFREARMPVVIVRPFNVFGPRRTGDHALLSFILNAIQGGPLEVHGDGSQIRSWCYIEDFCQGLMATLARSEAVGEDFNIGHPGNTLTIAELARKVIDLADSRSTIVEVPNPFPDIGIRVPSISKAQNLLGYEPQYSLDDALALTIDWYREHQDRFAHLSVSARKTMVAAS